MNAAPAVRRGSRDDRAYVRDLAHRSASSSISAVRPARDEDVIESFDRLAEFVYRRRHDVLIAEEDGRRIGFLLLLFDVPDEVTLTPQAFVAYMAVEPDARERGIGQALLRAAEEGARAAGLGYVSLMVTEQNVPAMALYEHGGYITERRMLTKVL
jgi:ribosomal protein S18 acetylase RimI-like enzyme